MPMSIVEIERSLRALRLSGMSAALQARSLQVTSGDMTFIEGFSALVQDELDRRQSRLHDRRFAASGLTVRRKIEELDWSYNPKLPRRDILDLATLNFIDRKENALFIGKPGTGKSHTAMALALKAIHHGSRVLYRPAHELLEEVHAARQMGTLAKTKSALVGADLLVIDDLFLRKLPKDSGDELAEILLSRYENTSTIITSNRPIDDWATLLGDIVVVGPLLDRVMHHGRLLRFEGKSWRLKEAAENSARRGGSGSDYEET